MEKYTKISIIIPTYNRGYIITRAINSIVKQKFKEWELIIVDDGSSDNTDRVIYPFTNDKRVTYIKLPVNKGFFAARNEGIKKAKGEWVSFLDSDDEYSPNGLSIIAHELNKIKHSYDIAQFSIVLDNKKDNMTREAGYLSATNWDYYQPTYSDIVFKRGILNDMHRCIRTIIAKQNLFPEAGQGFETLYYADLAKKGIRSLYIHQAVVRVHLDCEDQLTFHKTNTQKKSLSHAYSRYVYEHYDVLKSNPQALINQYLSLAAWCKDQYDPKAVIWLYKAFLFNPLLCLQILKSKLL